MQCESALPRKALDKRLELGQQVIMALLLFRGINELVRDIDVCVHIGK